MSRRMLNRVLAGPFDGHLSHSAVRDLFDPYGKVLRGGWYHRTQHVPTTFGYVEMEDEKAARRAILGLVNGRWRQHGERTRMTFTEPVGPLPLGLDEWAIALSIGWCEDPSHPGHVDGAQAEESSSSSSNVKGPSDPADFYAELSKDVKPEQSPGAKMDPSGLFKLPERKKKAPTGRKEEAAESLTLLAIHRDEVVETPDEDQPAVEPKDRAT